MKRILKQIIKQVVLSRIIVYRLPESGTRRVLFTFDDGPHPEITPRLLALLDQYNVRALFFLVGKNIEKHPEIVDEIHARGHLIGNHTYDHPKGKFPSLADYRENLLRCQELIQHHTGAPPVWYRPPRGTINLPNLYLPRTMGLKTMLWSAEGGEWGVRRSAETPEITAWLKENITPGDIVLLHDDSRKTLPVLEELLPFLAERQYDLRGGVEAL